MPGYLFKNANVIRNGTTGPSPSCNVLVKGDRIAVVTREPIEAGDAAVIDVAGRTLMS